jgi:hypothetical protein
VATRFEFAHRGNTSLVPLASETPRSVWAPHAAVRHDLCFLLIKFNYTIGAAVSGGFAGA